MRVSRRQLVLGIATVLVLMLAVRTFWPSTPAQAPTTPARARTTARPAAAQPATAPPGQVGPVKLDALTAERQGPGEAERNPFRYKPKPVPPPPKPTVVAPPPADSAGPARAPVPTGTPPLPPIPLKLIGVLERANGVKWAVLTDGKSGPMYGKDGDIIDGRFAIVKIGAESIEMTYADGRGRQVIRLSGQ